MYRVTRVQTWMRLFAFHIVLISLGKICIHFPSSYVYIIGQTGLFKPWYGNWSKRRKTLNLNICLKLDFMSHPAHVEGFVNTSSCRATSMNIPDPLSPLLPIVHRPQQVFRATSRILT